MKTGFNGIELIKSFEGCRLTGYLCPAKIPTIGYGHTGLINGKAVKVGAKITMDQAIDLLKDDLEKFEARVNKYPKYKWTQNEFDALVSFAYNHGTIDDLTDDGTRTRKVISEKLLEYDKARVNGVLVPLKGLTRRREVEQILFNTSCKPKETVTSKSSIDDIMWIQAKLNDRLKSSHGYIPLIVDGDYGNKTKVAVCVFWDTMGWNKDNANDGSKCGKLTIDELDK